MSAFLAAILSFPTVVFTVLLGFFLLYAIATLLGALDIEWLDGLLGVDDVNDSVLEGGLHALGVAGIPLTIFGGAATIFGWLAAFIGDRFLPDGVVIDTLILFGALLAGLFVGSRAVRPLRGAFVTPDGPHRRQLVGRVCTIRSLQVSDRSGTAEVGDVVAEVRCFRENDLTLGSKAIVYDYDDKEGIYHVGPIDPTIAT
ncbi:MAG TPA: hypothetical protein VHK90_18440 [Thermoanaerobaculia bacterium]|nr:hypothetical protein [Thermoanaerobaculia bacterium]